jgi:hypothetical protein
MSSNFPLEIFYYFVSWGLIWMDLGIALGHFWCLIVKNWPSQVSPIWCQCLNSSRIQVPISTIQSHYVHLLSSTDAAVSRKRSQSAASFRMSRCVRLCLLLINSKGLSFSFPLPFIGPRESATSVQIFKTLFRGHSFYLCVLALEPTFWNLFAPTPPKISKIGPSNSKIKFNAHFLWF